MFTLRVVENRGRYQAKHQIRLRAASAAFFVCDGNKLTSDPFFEEKKKTLSEGARENSQEIYFLEEIMKKLLNLCPFKNIWARRRTQTWTLSLFSD